MLARTHRPHLQKNRVSFNILSQQVKLRRHRFSHSIYARNARSTPVLIAGIMGVTQEF